MQFPFGMLAPDLGDLGSGYMLQADGVQPLRDGYGPYPGLSVASTAVALSGAPRGMLGYQTADGTWAVIAFTDSTAELKLADDTWSVVDSGLTTTSGDDWSYVRFGTKLLYTNTAEGLRAYDVEAGGAASAIAAAKDPRFIFECGNILFGLDCLDNLDNRNNRLIRSTAFSDHTNWTTKGADYQPLESGGALIWGGKLSDTSALILQQRAVRLLQVGNVGNALWGLQSISEEFGSVGAKSCINFDGSVWWWATDGLRQFTMGGGITKPFDGKMDRWFLDRVDQSDLSLIQGAIDPFRKNVLWRWKRADNASNTIFEDIIGLHIPTGKPFTLTVQTTYLGFSAQTAQTWDSMPDDLTWDGYDSIIWDSRFLQGGQPIFGAMDASFKFGYFTGGALAATLETSVADSPIQTLLGFARPEDDSPDGTMELGVRNAPDDATTWKTGQAKQSSGRVPMRGRGKYVQFRRNITANSSWKSARGVDDVQSAGGAQK
jgi:hypothetical protein